MCISSWQDRWGDKFFSKAVTWCKQLFENNKRQDCKLKARTLVSVFQNNFQYFNLVVSRFFSLSPDESKNVALRCGRLDLGSLSTTDETMIFDYDGSFNFLVLGDKLCPQSTKMTHFATSHRLLPWPFARKFDGWGCGRPKHQDVLEQRTHWENCPAFVTYASLLFNPKMHFIRHAKNFWCWKRLSIVTNELTSYAPVKTAELTNHFL